ncbi:hypothetical protein DM02DRAFT_546309, partial [Periconia macrospinosa]
YFTLCTLLDLSKEFLLTENAFSIYKGPISYLVNSETEEKIITAYTEFYILGVILLNLVILLQSNLLLEVFKDRDKDIRKQKALMLFIDRISYSYPKSARLVLKDLLVAKA